MLEAYQTQCEKGWSFGPNDGYFFDHLIDHLEKAKRYTEIHQLLQEESKEGKNCWYEAQERRVNIARYLTDVKRALELVKVDEAQSSVSQNIGRQCLYALIIASINSLAKNIPDELLVQLVKHNKWNQKQGLTYALQITEPFQRFNTLIKLASHLKGKLKDEALPKALEAATAIVNEEARAEALTALISKVEKLSISVLLDFWQKTVECFCYRNRQESLKDLEVLTPIIFKLGSLEAIEEVVRAIERVTRWWP